MMQNLQYPEVEGDYLRNSRGQLTLAFRLELPQLFTLSGPDYDEINSALSKAVAHLSPGHIVHKQDWFITQQHHAPAEAARSELAAAHEQHFDGRSYLVHSSYLFMSRHLFASQRKNNRSFEAEILETCASDFLEHFAKTGIRVVRLRHKDLVGTETTPGLLQQYAELGFEQMPAGQVHQVNIASCQQISLEVVQGENRRTHEAATHYLPDLVPLKPVDLATYSVNPKVNLPLKWKDGCRHSIGLPSGLAAPIGELLPGNHIFNQFLLPWCKDDFLEYAEQVQTPGFGQLILNAITPWRRRDREWECQYYGAICKIGLTERVPVVRAHYQLITWPHDANESLQSSLERREQAHYAIRRMGLSDRVVGKTPMPGLEISVPGNADQLHVEQTFFMNAKRACANWILETNTPAPPPRSNPALLAELVQDSIAKGNGGEKLLLAPLRPRATIGLADRLTGVPERVDVSCVVDSWFGGAGHKLLVGEAGSGRSYLLKHLIREYCEQKVPVMVIDPVYPDDRVPLFQALGGQILRVKPENLPGFNPFLLISPAGLDNKRAQHLLSEQIEAIIALLERLWELETGQQVPRMGRKMLGKTLPKYFTWLSLDKTAVAGFDSFYEFFELDQLTWKDTGEKACFLSAMAPYYQGGPRALLLNSPAPWQWHQGPCLVLLSAVRREPKLFAALYLLLVDHCYAAALIKPIQRLIVLDDADWYLNEMPVLAKQLEYMLTGGRWTPRLMELLVVSQQLKPSWESPHMKELLYNIPIKMMMRLSRSRQSELDYYQWFMNAYEADQVQSLQYNNGGRYTEVFIKNGNESGKVYRVEVSAAEHALYTARCPREVPVN